MLQRRGAISFDKTDKTAVYVRQLGKHLLYTFYATCCVLKSVRRAGFFIYLCTNKQTLMYTFFPVFF